MAEERNNITDALFDAVSECTRTIEEEGGLILRNSEGKFIYHKLRNANTGTQIAPVLWTADRMEYARIIMPQFSKGWKNYASFHTHPQFMPHPSSVDLNQLFLGFPVNFIYSPVTREVTQWNYIEAKQFEHAGTFDVSYIPTGVTQVNLSADENLGIADGAPLIIERRETSTYDELETDAEFAFNTFDSDWSERIKD